MVEKAHAAREKNKRRRKGQKDYPAFSLTLPSPPKPPPGPENLFFDPKNNPAA